MRKTLASARQGSCVPVKGGWVASVWQIETADLVPLNLVNMELSIAQALVQEVGNDRY
jgi:preprotein translocase subunit YajC